MTRAWNAYFFFFFGFSLLIFTLHSPFFSLPYFWDELGQFIPAALDLLHDGALVPHSAVPNVHPPAVMAWLAAVWKAVGYSLPATRAAMLVLASAGATFSFLLAIQLCQTVRGAPAFAAVFLLLLDPLFYTQSMMAQLDMPAMVFTLLGLLLFLKGRHGAATIVCTVAVLAKETAILLPLICAATLLWERRSKTALLYMVPCVALAAWLFLLWRSTGHIFGDPAFAHYNIGYSLHPVRATISLLRRIYYLFLADFRWIGAIAIVYGWRRGLYRGRSWAITGLFVFSHILLVSLLGGAELERYLLPVLPVVYIATAAAWSLYSALWRNLSLAGMALGLLAGSFFNPPYPFPFENNLAMVDFVELHHAAAHYLQLHHPQADVFTAWPLTAALRSPEFGYVDRPIKSTETSDLHASTLSRLNPDQVEVLVLYSRTWEPALGLQRIPWIRRLLSHFYEYEPQMTAVECADKLGLHPEMRWTRRGQWIEVYSRDVASPGFQARR